MSAEIRNQRFTASVPLYFSIFTSDEIYWTEHEEKLATKAIAVHILKKNSKEIEAQMEAENNYEDYGQN